MISPIKDAYYAEGQQAYRAGKKAEDNPHEPDSTEWLLWRAGWKDAYLAHYRRGTD